MNKNLKPVPANQKGLKELPTRVRNNMGYLNKGSFITKMTMKDAEKIVSDENKFENYSPEEIKKARNMMMQDATGPLLEEDMVNVGGKFISPPKKKPKTPDVPKCKPKMMYGGMANKKKHNYAGGGSVQDKLGVMIAVGKIKPRSKNGKSS